MEEKQLKYYKMHHDLEEQIHRGELRAGDRVPSENQLAAAYQVIFMQCMEKEPLYRSGYVPDINPTI